MNECDDRPRDALRQLRDRFSDCMQVVYDRLVFAPTLHHLRSWAVLTSWGLGELATLEDADEQLPAPALLTDLLPQHKRLRAAVSAFREGRGSLGEVAWEVERLESLADEALAGLLAAGHLKAWHQERRRLETVLAGLWKLLRRHPRPQGRRRAVWL